MLKDYGNAKGCIGIIKLEYLKQVNRISNVMIKYVNIRTTAKGEGNWPA
jgi:hypothetical protein